MRPIHKTVVSLAMAAALSVPCMVWVLAAGSTAKPQVQMPITFTEPDTQPVQEEPIEYKVPAADPADITMIAQTLWGECRGVKDTAQQAAVAWCIFNRVDDPRWPDTVAGVCIPSQFNGYNPNNPVDPALYNLALDVYHRWQLEKLGEADVGRTLPKEYVYFLGNDKTNEFTIEFYSGEAWGWELPDPYVI